MELNQSFPKTSEKTFEKFIGVTYEGGGGETIGMSEINKGEAGCKHWGGPQSKPPKVLLQASCFS